ncbi:DUF397 domain-containing protein [Embleya sp. NPDC005575]|uniref:DUF397 domain-containing protein n=1 Tax=Embleya sp. NPDC005575 TaxID=3156892 RepID=UPI0033ACAF63
MPENTMPANTMPANTMPANTMPANTMPANTMPANTSFRWVKSSYSMQNGDCAEIRPHLDGAVDVRDSKDPAVGLLTLGNAPWAAFVGTLRPTA